MMLIVSPKIRRLAYIAAALSWVLPTVTHASDTLLKEVPISAENVVATKNATFTLTFGSRKWIVPAKTASLWFKVRRTENGDTVLQLRPQAIYDYLNTKVSPLVNKPGENSRFEYLGPNLHLIEGGHKGTIVDGIKTSLAIRAALANGQTSATVSMKEHRPTLFSADDFKKLKFPEQLTRGESNFAGSPANRRHNIGVATAKFNGLVILPGEEFSFNQYLDDVDEANGYKPELVIKENVTTPEFGGGICQVSTTAFRAAMQSGMKITYRRNHSYPVKYYGTPGYDATVYQPFPDFRFVNDTKNPILLKTSIAGTKVYFDVWGTKDSRQVTINGPFVTEKKPDGSLTAAVAQIVKQNGKVIREENFVSKYQSPDKFPIERKENGE
jgi:vancomycin resistance protein YoaR